MHDLGAFPGIVPGEAAIEGELYEVDAATLVRLDRLEGHPHFYRRTPIKLHDGSEVETYVLSLAHVSSRPVIASGDWRSYRSEACAS